MQNLQQLGKDIWCVALPFQTFGCRLGTRTTIVRSGKRLLLISPGSMDWDELSKLGEVSAIVAPNKMHHLFLSEALERFPAATLFLAPGLSEKRPDLPAHEVLPADIKEWGLLNKLMPGMPELNEVLFFHQDSRTLVLTDLAFNFGRHPHLPTRWMLRLNGAHDRFGPTRVFKHYFLKEPAIFRSALEEVLQWPFEQVVVGHGEVVERDGPGMMERAFRGI